MMTDSVDLLTTQIHVYKNQLYSLTTTRLTEIFTANISSVPVTCDSDCFNNGGVYGGGRRNPKGMNGRHKHNFVPTSFVPSAREHALIEAFGGNYLDLDNNGLNIILYHGEHRNSSNNIIFKRKTNPSLSEVLFLQI
ncbi:hypothetical protein HN51_026838 [Arachis hypogaea]